MQLVFVHGSGAIAAVWQYQTDFFHGSDAVDLPGHPEGELLPRVEECVAWLKAYVDERDYEDVVIVGHSLGGAIALLYALEHADDLSAIVLVGSGARLRVHPQTLQTLERAIDSPALFTEMMQGMYAQVAPAVARSLLDRSESLGPAAFLNDLRACDRFDVIDRLAEISVPTLALCATGDVMTPPKYSHFLAERIAGAQTEVLDGGTHMVFLEKPDEVNAAIDRFLRGL